MSLLYFWILFIIFLYIYIKYSKYSENIPKRAAAHALVGGLLGGSGRVGRLKNFLAKCMPKPTWKMNRDSARVPLTEEAKELIPSSNMLWIMAKAWGRFRLRERFFDVFDKQKIDQIVSAGVGTSGMD